MSAWWFRIPLLFCFFDVGVKVLGEGCFSEGFLEKDCCNLSYGPRGHDDCWDEMYNPELCCPNFGANDNSVAGFGCSSNYFQGLGAFSKNYMNEKNLTLPGIISWGVVMRLLAEKPQVEHFLKIK